MGKIGFYFIVVFFAFLWIKGEGGLERGNRLNWMGICLFWVLLTMLLKINKIKEDQKVVCIPKQWQEKYCRITKTSCHSSLAI
ncbi:hypothetical protein GDO78_021622 [Eleutherodactylus coqui]|uniref:Uncharacterized protein n=1 Tax=Eleutherodactylus coqui TaxID=57060 RepID=A0A8J6AYK8_ELECQ|nr:hypothetical protein GDO78_021622 [Eleutherodactylus coqui]